MISRSATLPDDIDRNRLLETMAQEIRRPLNAILGMIELLIDSPLAPEQLEYARLIQNSGDELLILVNDLLDYAHLGSGELELAQTAVDLRSCMDDALEMLASHTAEKSPSIACFIEPGVPEVIQADPIRLRQVLSRLMGYAVQLAGGSEIVAAVKARPQGLEQYEIQFVIKQYGSPISRPGGNALEGSRQDAGSMRLGLEICRLLIEKMGGSLTSTHQQPRNVLFAFTIQAEAGRWQPARRRQRSTQPLMGGKNILLVVAEEPARANLAQQLNYWQLRPIQAESADQALGILASGEALDLAILEEQLPDLDAYELARCIRQSKTGHSLPIILVTPRAEEQQEPPLSLSTQVTAPAKPYQLYEAISRTLAEQLRIQPAAATATLLDPGMAQRHPLRILLADPETGEQKVTLRFLERLGYRPEHVDHPAEVLQALLRKSFDVLIVDQELLVREIALLEKLEQLLPPIARPAVLVLAAQDTLGDKKAAFTGGVQDFVFKPVRAGDLILALEDCRPLRLDPTHVETIGERDAGGLAPVAITDDLMNQSGDPAISPAYLIQLSTMAGEGTAVLLAQLVDIFTASAARLLVQMQQAIDSQDAEALHQAAAMLRTSSENLGAMRLAELCAAMEGESRLPDMQMQMRQILAEYNRVRARLEHLRKDTGR